MSYLSPAVSCLLSHSLLLPATARGLCTLYSAAFRCFEKITNASWDIFPMLVDFTCVSEITCLVHGLYEDISESSSVLF